MPAQQSYVSTYTQRLGTKWLGSYSLIEIIVLFVTFAALLRLAVPNVREFITRASDASAYRVYTDVRDLVTRYAEDPDGAPTSLIFNQSGEGLLPRPYDKVMLHRGMRLNYLISLHYPGFFDLLAIEISHDRGSQYFRFIEVNGKRFEQVIQR